VKLSKSAIKSHNEAMALVALERDLKDWEKEFILENFNEGALHINSAAGAFFTPNGLARDFSIEVAGGRTIDLCAGIGALSYAVEHKVDSLVCVEINADYLRIGKKIVPGATWVHASAFSPAVLGLGFFDIAISNPPFGAITEDDYTGIYRGGQFEYKIMELASRVARYGVFILPQASANFEYSGKRYFRSIESAKAKAFREQTGIIMQPNCGIDTAIYKNDWRGVSPICEIVICEFPQAEDQPKKVAAAPAPAVATRPIPVPEIKQGDLFAMEAA
jgi:predicted RNA methylase